MNGNKGNARVVKTYVCRCGEVNRFSLETDFNVSEVRIDAHCQGCGKEISISIENFFRTAAGTGNGANYSQPSQTNQTNNSYYGNDYDQNSNSQNPQSESNPTLSQISQPRQYDQVQYSTRTESPSSNTAPSEMPEFNFDALTSAAESIAPPVSEVLSQIEQTQTNPSPDNYPNQIPSVSSPENIEVINSLSSDIMEDSQPDLPEVAEPAPPLAANIVLTPARRIMAEAKKDEEEDLISYQKEVEGMYTEKVSSEDQEAFIDLFGRM